MTPESWSEVLAALAPLGAGDKFVDLGSGRGTLVCQAALEVPGMRCVGVELSRKRHAMAGAAAKRLRAVAERKGCPACCRGAPERVDFVCEDMRTFDLTGTTVVYLMNQVPAWSARAYIFNRRVVCFYFILCYYWV